MHFSFKSNKKTGKEEKKKKSKNFNEKDLYCDEKIDFDKLSKSIFDNNKNIQTSLKNSSNNQNKISDKKKTDESDEIDEIFGNLYDNLLN